jgi:hypothetical protein
LPLIILSRDGGKHDFIPNETLWKTQLRMLASTRPKKNKENFCKNLLAISENNGNIEKINNMQILTVLGKTE